MKLTKERKEKVLSLVASMVDEGLSRAEMARVLKPLICRSELYRLLDRKKEADS